MNKKIIVGIVPTNNLFQSDSPYDDTYKFVNLYSKKIIQVNAIPIGILMEDGNVNAESLEICDAFLIQGGNKVYKYIYEIISFAIEHNKPLLGICLGAEALAIYSWIIEKLDKNKNYSIENIVEIYTKLREENEGTLLKLIESPNKHGDMTINRENIDNARHSIEILEESILYDIFKQKKLNVVSLHSYDFKHVGSKFLVSARASDNVCEAIEFRDRNYFILGIHFHAELEDNNLIFERLVEESRKRKRII